MNRKRSDATRGHSVLRVAVMLREEALSVARRRPLTTSLHLAVSRESSRLDDAERREAARTTRSTKTT
jgi:hypothetical protein